MEMSSLMDLLEHIFVINLNERRDRLHHVSQEFLKIGKSFERIEAIKHINGAMGAQASHIKALELAIERGYEQILICEDDITFTRPEVFLKSMDLFHENHPERWDMLLIAGVIYSSQGESYKTIEAHYCRLYEAQTCTGYIVQKHYYPILLENFKEGQRGYLEVGTRWDYAIDAYWKRLQRRDEWYFLTPPTIIQYANWSNIENHHADYERGMLCLQDIPVEIEDVS
jgi:glycosyl transferase family 25